MVALPAWLRLRRGPRIDEYRLAVLYGIGLGLHAVIDPVVTYVEVADATARVEANPFLRWALMEGVPTFVGVHIPFLVVGVAGFYALLYFIRQAEPPTDRRLAGALKVGSIGFILWGIAIAVWNLQGVV